MSMVIQCNSCGGALVYDARSEAAKCLFCGSTSLEVNKEEVPPIPHALIPDVVERSAADEQYRAWARSSWFTPTALRNLSVSLSLIYLPAWSFRGEVETHWSGLTRAMETKSKKRPTRGVDKANLQQMVAASQGLSQEEVDELTPWDEAQAVPWSADAARGTPVEMPALSEEGARKLIHDLMGEKHQQMIALSENLVSSKASALVFESEVKLYLLPVWIGAFRFRDRPWRFIVNAQTGEVVGDPPIDRVKMAMLIVGFFVVMWIAAALFM